MKMRVSIAVIAVVLTAVFASTALAAGNSSSKSAYGKKGAKRSGRSCREDSRPSRRRRRSRRPKVVAAKSATLPFTGLDLGFIAGAGIVLVGMGLSLRRVTRKQPHRLISANTLQARYNVAERGSSLRGHRSVGG